MLKSPHTHTHTHSVIISVWIADTLVKLFIVYAINVTIDWGQNFHNLTSISCVSTSPSLPLFPTPSAVIFMHCCIVKYFAFNCTPDWSILFGALFAWQIFRSAGRQQQAGRQAVSFPYFQLPYIATPLAFVGIWRRFIDCRRRFWARNFCLHLLPRSGSFYMLFLEHFQQNTLRFSFLQQLRCAFKWHLKYLSWVLAHNFINAASAACLPDSAACLLLQCVHISHVYLWH